jgi:hypothetical protein
MSDDEIRDHLERAAKLVASLSPMTNDRTRDPRAILDVYIEAVRNLRAVARDARARVERAETVVMEASNVVRRRRRRAHKIAARRSAESGAGTA